MNLTRRAVLAGAGALAVPRRRKRRREVGWRIPVLTANEVILVGNAGLFAYSPTPAFGNLVYSSAPQNGTDAYGNAYLAGSVSYALISGGSFEAVQQNAERIAWLTAAGAGGPWILQASIVFNPFSTPADVLTIQAGSNPLLIGASAVNPFTTAAVEIQGGSAQPALELVPAAAGNEVIGVRIGTDTTDRLAVDGNGQLSWGPGNAASDAQLHRLAANSMSFKTCDLSVETIGRGLRVREGTNAKQGRATLVAGTVVVADTAITASSIIVPGYVTPAGANSGAVFVSSVTVGTGFTLKSTNAADTSVVGYQIFEPA